ncbi:hypothetical protein QN277_004607 [Acacia crassicarpa]|uniref:Uncharacterized protein n=1 Tax=Acacia crassicarpa TaxID=499986 RepID=A0AAE1J0R2_9FABA|nr:hypothetical protein QN277_004607 [Acacia crassicarpa]
MTMRSKCRLWWPKQLLSRREPSSSFLLGWFVTSSPASLDIIVAFTCNKVLLSQSSPCLEEILHDVHGKMPIILQDKSTFSILGQCVPDQSNSSLVAGIDDNKWKLSNCGRLMLDGSSEHNCQASCGKSNWILLTFDSREQNDTGFHRIPKLQHIHWNGLAMLQYDVHVIIYDTPYYGSHHFSLCPSNSHKQAKTSIKKPRWVGDLHKKEQLIDLDMVILAINCSAAAKGIFERHEVLRRSFSLLSMFLVFFAFVGNLAANSVASLSTLFFVVLQLCQALFNDESGSWVYMASAIFRTAWINIRIRCCQILYWPIFLQENDFRSRSCVEYAEKAAMHRHSMWSTLVVDVFLGNMIGWALLNHAEFICLSVLTFVHDIANPFLRSGCVWLMGNPAGFKLNSEVAGVLGMVSLNAIQIWSTLWTFVGFVLNYIIQGLAIIGILCGFTLPAALIIDMIVLATSHVSTLYWLISLLYSSQIQAVAALWRLFRGQKWNPLRQRKIPFWNMV